MLKATPNPKRTSHDAILENLVRRINRLVVSKGDRTPDPGQRGSLRDGGATPRRRELSLSPLSPSTQELRTLGHDVVPLEQLGHADQGLDDDAVLALATAHGRAVLTINRRHLVRLHEEQPAHSGIVVCTLDIDFVGQARRIAATVTANEDLSGKLFRINRPG